MRLIDADAFAEKIKEISSRNHYDKLLINKPLTVQDVLDSVIAELNGTGLDGFENCPTVEERPVAEWISVHDKIPKCGERVLLSLVEEVAEVNEKSIVIAYRDYKEWSEDEYEWIEEEGLGFKISYDENEVAAWMPLPEPPKEGGQE